jgi:hypothetical protein
MNREPEFDPLPRFAELERLVSKIYFRFSHLFLDNPDLRDFWWEMAREEEQHACILFACKALIENYDETLDPTISPEKAQELETRLLSFLGQGTPSLTVEQAFRIALEIENSEIDAIYSKLVHLGGPHIAKTMENLGVPASVQRRQLKAALRRFCADPGLLSTAESL